jgi:hypothetical protein
MGSRFRGHDAVGRETTRGNFKKGSGDIAEEKFRFRMECQGQVSRYGVRTMRDLATYAAVQTQI